MLSGILYGIYSDMASILTFFLTSILAFYVVFYLTYFLAFIWGPEGRTDVRKEEEKVTLIKSRDPHVAGGKNNDTVEVKGLPALKPHQKKNYIPSSDPHHGIQFIPSDILSGLSIWHSIWHVF